MNYFSFDFPLQNQYHKPKQVKIITDAIWLNKSNYITVGDIGENYHTTFLGMSGKGKSVACAIYLSQVKNAIFIDPALGGGFNIPLSFLGEKKNWRTLELSEIPVSKSKELKINVREVGRNAYNLLYYNENHLNTTERNIRQTIKKFFTLDEKDPRKTYSELMKIFTEYPKADHLKDALEKIFDHHDKAKPLQELQTGRWRIKAEGLDPNNLSLAVFLGAILDSRQLVAPKQSDEPHPFGKLFLGIDEANTFGASNTRTGGAFDFIINVARKLEIAGVICGIEDGSMKKGTKTSIRFKFFFQNDKYRKQIWSDHLVDLDPDLFENMARMYPTQKQGKGNCCFKDGDDVKWIHFDSSYKKIGKFGFGEKPWILKETTGTSVVGSALSKLF